MEAAKLGTTVGNYDDYLIELANRTQIFDCLKRVSRGIDRFDRAMFLSAYHPDAIISAGALVSDPSTAFDGGSALHDNGQTGTQHHLTNHTSEIEGDIAHCETYYIYAGRNRDGTDWLAGGRYVDRVERRDGVWRIAFRHTLIEWSGTIAGTEVPLFLHAPDAAANGLPSRDRSDPSYRRPLNNQRQPSVPTNMEHLGKLDAEQD